MRILLADDHQVVRRGLQMVLSLEKDFEIVGEASTGGEAVTRAKELAPDLILMDLKMPGLSGSAAARKIKSALPHTRVLILTGVENEAEIIQAMDAGADGYILKDVSPEELTRAIRAIGAGETYLQPDLTKRMIQRMRDARARPQPPKQFALTSRECEILQAMASSATYREIATQLSISEETVKTHAKNILAKLEQPNRTQAVMVALREGLIALN
ncbi:MAG: response regulator transcription factor [Chloroflexi bacterium]|nr:response regulator transcription factor [Chloroflexota bacterium]